MAAASFLQNRLKRVAWGRKAIIGVPLLFLLIFFLLPFLVVFKISLSDMGNTVFSDLWLWSDGVLQIKLQLGNYLFLLQDDLYIQTYLRSLKFAGITTVICLLMILPLYANLVKMDLRLIEAALNLGATPWQAFWLITVPISRAGIMAGSLLVLIPCVGEFVIPELLGGPQTLMIGRVLWDEFFRNNDWPMAAAVAVIMVLLIIVPLALFNYDHANSQAGRHA